MGDVDSLLDAEAVARAKALLQPAARRERVWPALAAASLLAVSAVGFAAAMVLAPPLQTEPVARSAPG